MVEDGGDTQEQMSAAAVLQFAAREAREGRRLAEFGAHAFATITYNAYGTLLFLKLAHFIVSLDGNSSIRFTC